LLAGDCYLTDVHPFGGDTSHKTPVPPLAVAAFGTSVTWGDGLHQANTFRYRVSSWLAQMTQRRVLLWTFAHSDSYLAEIAGDKEYSPDPYNGALNGNYPTVDQQIDCAVSEFGLGGADLILVEGCANEVDTKYKRLVWFGTDPEVIRQDAQKYCMEPMRKILGKLQRLFPRATIVVSGYYPLFSQQSGAKRDRGLTRLIKRSAASLPASAAPLPKGWPGIKDRLVAISDAFYTSSKQALSDAVAAAASGPAVRLFYAGLPEVNGTVDPNWAYRAPDTHQWRIPIPYLAWLSSSFVAHPDEEFTHRNRACLALYKTPLDKFLCQTNTGFHPNVQGAEAYASSIESAIPAATLAGWKRN
jgi:hypothetical protein